MIKEYLDLKNIWLLWDRSKLWAGLQDFLILVFKYPFLKSLFPRIMIVLL